MVDFLRDFIHILRSSDIKISTAESIDAMRVVSLIGLDDKPLLQDSLSQTLAKNLREKVLNCFILLNGNHFFLAWNVSPVNVQFDTAVLLRESHPLRPDVSLSGQAYLLWPDSTPLTRLQETP